MGSCCSWIYHELVAYMDYLLPVGVAVYNDVGIVDAGQLVGFRGAQFVAMADVDVNSIEAQVERLDERWVARRIGVPENGLHRRNHA